MTTSIQRSLGLITVLSALSLTACGQGFKVQGSNSLTSNNIQSVADVKAQIDEAQKATDDAEAAMAEAQAAVASISDANGNIDIDLFSVANPATVAPQGLLSPVIDRLKGVFDTVIAKVKIVTEKFDMARAALAAAMAKLDPNVPAQAAMIEQITQALAKVDFLESQFHGAMQMLAGKLDLATSAINNLINTGCSFIPIPGACAIVGIIVDTVLMNDVKALIAHFKAELLAL